MGTIGRTTLKLADLIGKQIEDSNRFLDVSKLEKRLLRLEKQVTQGTASRDALGPSPDGPTYGYDYTVYPPTSRSYPNMSVRMDNFDIYGVTIPSIIADLDARIDVLEELISAGGTGGAAVSIVQVIPDSYISTLAMPDQMAVCRVWRNGLRLFEGDGYDYTFNGNTINLFANAGDRIIVEYTTAPTSS